MGRKKVNLLDVARVAGTSKSTVSRVLNNKLGNGFTVTDTVKQRILDVSKQLGYRPNLIAQSLSNQQKIMIHILGGSHGLHDLGDIYQTAVNEIVSIMDEKLEDGSVTVEMSSYKADKSELPPWHINAAVILARCNSATIEDLEESGIPYIVINGPAGKNGSIVVPDDVNGMRLAVKHLVNLGHKRIAYAGPQIAFLRGHSSVYDRHSTYIVEMEKYNLPPMAGHDKIFSTMKTYENLYKSAIQYMQSTVIQNKATAVIVYGHMEAMYLVQAAQSLGISVPQQLSVICFCDQHSANIMSPNMTFIDLMSQEMGKACAELLLKQLNHPEKAKPETLKVPEQLILRSTTSVAPKE
ncbi:MAG: LacI family DNA-binding transcriptional regulator [Phycisphaerales bacterium]